MKVKELIKLLNNFDPELDIVADTRDGSASIEEVIMEHDWEVLICTNWQDLIP